MNVERCAAVAIVALTLVAAPARAQPPPPKIGPFVVDLRGDFVSFPDTQGLADSRGIDLASLPGTAFGGSVGVHLYLLRWKAVTFGIGAEVVGLRAHSAPIALATDTTGATPVTEKFLSAAPQLSFNFGSGTGWSYISGGIGLSQWSVIPDGADSLDADTERLKTVDYGGGARWFIKPHLAFTFDVRVYVIAPGTPSPLGFPGSPRAALTVIGAGVSLKR